MIEEIMDNINFLEDKGAIYSARNRFYEGCRILLEESKNKIANRVA